MKKYAIVLARHNEDLSKWDGIENVVVVNHGSRAQTRHKVIDSVNIGHEAHAYLTYIVENYHNLPDMVCFFQADPNCAFHRNGKINEADLLRLFIDIPEGCSQNYEIKPFGFCLSQDYRIYQYPIGNWLVPYSTDGLTWFRQHVDGSADISHLKIWFGANFSVCKCAILSRPLEYYKGLLAQFNGVHCEVAHFFERAWYYIFQLDEKVQRKNPQDVLPA